MARPERRRGKIDQLAGLRGVALDARPARVDSRRVPAWLLGILLIAVPSQSLAAWRVFVDLPASSRPALLDSIIFEYIGWYLTQGGRIYIDVWELNTPGPGGRARGVVTADRAGPGAATEPRARGDALLAGSSGVTEWVSSRLAPSDGRPPAAVPRFGSAPVAVSARVPVPGRS
jgi:hypothetical protein